jgi:hypothetical protein
VPAATQWPLTISVEGQGTVSGASNGQLIDEGKTVVLKAKPARQWLFAEWGGSAGGNEPTLTFAMSSGYVAQATFVLSPFLDLKGAFNGLFVAADGVSPTNSGACDFALTDLGAFSGKLFLNGAKRSFSGRFDLDGHAQVTIPPKGLAAAVELNMTMSFDGSDSISGTVSNSTFMATLTGYRACYHAKTNPAPQAGKYTLAIPGSANSATSPGGDSIGALTVDNGGRIKFKGALASGTAISAGSALSKQGYWGFFASALKGRELLLGWMTFSNLPSSDLAGTNLVWTKASAVTDKLYPQGFLVSRDVFGSKYVAPPSGTRALSWSNGLAYLCSGNIGLGFDSGVRLEANNSLVVTGANAIGLSLSLKSSSGLFKGKFNPPGALKPYPIQGALIQKRDVGRGHFLGTNQSGYAELATLFTNTAIATISEPLDGSTNQSGVVDVVGTVLPATAALRAELNGLAGPICADGAFAFRHYPLFDGVNVLSVRLYSGNTLVGSNGVTVHYVAPVEAASSFSAAAGGEVVVTNEASPLVGASLDVPAGAASRDLRIGITYDPEHLPAVPYGDVEVGPPVTFQPVGETFTAPVTLTVPVYPAWLPPGLTINDVRVLAFTDGGWAYLSVSDRLTEAVEVSVQDLAFDPVIAVVTIPLAPGQLRITSEPADATIYLDGFNTRWRTPATLSDVAAGTHTVKIYLPGFNEIFHTFSLPAAGGAEPGVAVHYPLAVPEAPMPVVTLDAAITDGRVVTDNIFTLSGSVTFSNAPLGGQLAVISQNGEDYFTPINGSGQFSEVISLLPGTNVVEVRVTGPNGSTGLSRRVRIINREGQGSVLFGGSGSTDENINVVLTWDTDDSDVDLHVFDPENRHAYWSSLTGIPGAQLDHDDVNGYGPETFTMLSPRPGTYHVRVNYFSTHGAGPTTARLNITIGSRLIFSGSYLLTQGDGNSSNGQPGDPASLWDAFAFTIGELEIVKIDAQTPSPVDNAIFTTDPAENLITLTVRKPTAVRADQLRLSVVELSRNQTQDTSGVRLSGTRMLFRATNSMLTAEEFATQLSAPLEYEFTVYTLDDSYESQPKTLKQDRLSQIRQEYIDQRALQPGFTLATPARNQILNGSQYFGPSHFTFGELAHDSDFSPALALVQSSQSMADTLREAWGAPLRLTSGWRNPRRNARLPEADLNSPHQTGNAIDINPAFTGPWPVVPPLAAPQTYQQAQRALKELAHRVFGAGYTVRLHGANPHVHIERIAD